MYKQQNDSRTPPAAKRKALNPIKNEGNINATQNYSKIKGNDHLQTNLLKSSSSTNNVKKGIFPRRLQENFESQKKQQPATPPPIRKMRTTQSQSQIPRLMKSPPHTNTIAKPSANKTKVIKKPTEPLKTTQEPLKIIQKSLKSSQGNRSSTAEQKHPEELSKALKTENKINQCGECDSELYSELPIANIQPEFTSTDITANIMCEIINQLNLKEAEKNIMKSRLPGFYMALPNFQGSVLSAFRAPNRILQYAWFRTTD